MTTVWTQRNKKVWSALSIHGQCKQPEEKKKKNEIDDDLQVHVDH